MSRVQEPPGPPDLQRSSDHTHADGESPTQPNSPSDGNGPGVAGLDADEAQGFRRLLQRHEQLALRSLRALTNDDSPPITKESASGSAPQLGNVVPASSAIDRLSNCLNQWGPLAFVAAADPTTSARDLSRIAHVAAITTAGAAALVAAAGERQELPKRQ